MFGHKRVVIVVVILMQFMWISCVALLVVIYNLQVIANDILHKNTNSHQSKWSSQFPENIVKLPILPKSQDGQELTNRPLQTVRQLGSVMIRIIMNADSFPRHYFTQKATDLCKK